MAQGRVSSIILQKWGSWWKIIPEVLGRVKPEIHSEYQFFLQEPTVVGGKEKKEKQNQTTNYDLALDFLVFFVLQ